jgi:hypothetical protein
MDAIPPDAATKEPNRESANLVKSVEVGGPGGLVAFYALLHGEGCPAA